MSMLRVLNIFNLIFKQMAASGDGKMWAFDGYDLDGESPMDMHGYLPYVLISLKLWVKQILILDFDDFYWYWRNSVE